MLNVEYLFYIYDYSKFMVLQLLRYNWSEVIKVVELQIYFYG